MSASEFNRDVMQAKRHAAQGPVVITDRGEPSFVLLSIKDYRRLRERAVGTWSTGSIWTTNSRSSSSLCVWI